MPDDKKILHVGSVDKFIPPFIKFIQEKFNPDEHHFLLSYGMASKEIINRQGINCFDRGLFNRFKFWISFFLNAGSSEKIIIHGLFDVGVILLLALQPWLLKKSCWAIWGGDLYSYRSSDRTIKWRITEFFKKLIVPRLGHFITHVKGDYGLARQWYGAKGTWHECFLYPSNLYKKYPLESSLHQGTNILLGNSATPTNNHFNALERLMPFANNSIRIYCPLSYGDPAYAEEIEQAGKKMFGEKFIALRSFTPFEEYLRLLARIDIAVFNHDRQQAMGNITTLLGLGKKVYMRTDLSSWNVFSSIGAVVFDINDLEMKPLESGLQSKNAAAVANYFSTERLVDGWRNVFDAK